MSDSDLPVFAVFLDCFCFVLEMQRQCTTTQAFSDTIFSCHVAIRSSVVKRTKVST